VTTMHRFVHFFNGRYPSNDALALGPDGFLYGTCYHGGAKAPRVPKGVGTMFKIAPGSSVDDLR